MTIHAAAVQVLRATGNGAAMWGDSVLLHQIANRAQARSANRSWRTERAILSALSRAPGELVPGYARVHRQVRCFWLPECVPPRLASQRLSSRAKTRKIDTL